MKVESESEVAQSCLTLSNPMDCSLPGSSIHGIFQARVLEWGAIAFSATRVGGVPDPVGTGVLIRMGPRQSRETILPLSPEGTDTARTLTLGFPPSELRQNPFLWLQSMTFCYISLSKRIHQPSFPFSFVDQATRFAGSWFPNQGSNTQPRQVEAQSPNHRTTREFPYHPRFKCPQESGGKRE